MSHHVPETYIHMLSLIQGWTRQTWFQGGGEGGAALTLAFEVMGSTPISKIGTKNLFFPGKNRILWGTIFIYLCLKFLFFLIQILDNHIYDTNLVS